MQRPATSRVKTATPREWQVAFALGGFGLALLALPLAAPGHFPPAPPWPGAAPLVLFLLVIVATRATTWQGAYQGAIALDTPAHVTAAMCLGSVLGGWLVALALLTDALLHGLTEGPHAASTRTRSLAALASLGALGGALVMVTGLVFGADASASGTAGEPWRAILRVPAYSVTLLVLQELVPRRLGPLATAPAQAGRYRRVGRSLVAEATLLPLAIVMVMVYQPHRLAETALLGIAYVLVNLVFRWLALTRAKLARRGRELSLLNRSAHAFAHTLELPALAHSILRSAAEALGPVVEVVLTMPDQHGEFCAFVYDPADGQVRPRALPPRDGLWWWVYERKRSLCVSDARGGDEVGRSWIGVPLIVHDRALGVLSAHSARTSEFGSDQLNLLESLGAQAAVALQNARLYTLATQDGLTGLYVRRYLDSRLREEFDRAARFGGPLALVMLDLDDFKQLNDAFGHPVGDRVLREIAQVVRRSLRSIDIAARWGGEELAFLLPGTGLDAATRVAERIRRDIADHAIRVGEQATVHVTASLGVASGVGGRGDAEAQLVRRADEALYRAKRAGKNRVCAYDAGGDGDHLSAGF
jgi:diguanylate cyclase (GGDEF)-like protein